MREPVVGMLSRRLIVLMMPVPLDEKDGAEVNIGSLRQDDPTLQVGPIRANLLLQSLARSEIE